MKTKLLYSLLIILSFQSISAQKLSIQTGHSAGITDLAFSPDGNYLVSSGEDSKVVLWDMISSKQMNIFGGHSKTVNSIAFHPNKNLIASASDDKSVILWEYPSGKLIKSYYFFEFPVKSVAFSPDGLSLACGSEQVYIVDLKSHNYNRIGKISKKGYNALSYSGDGKYLAFGGKKNGRVYLYNIEKEKITKKIRIHSNDIIFDNTSEHVYIAGQLGNIKRIPLSRSLVKRKFNISSNYSWFSFNSVVLNDEYFIAANQDNYIYVYDKDNGARKDILNAHSDAVSALAINPSGRYLASAGKDRKILVWDLKKLALIKSMEGGADRVNNVSFSENGKLMFIGYNDGNFRIWNLDQKGKVLFQEHKKLTPLERYLRYKYSIDRTTDVINTDQILIKASLNQKDKYSDSYSSKEALIIWKLNKGKEMYTLKSKRQSDMQSFILKDSTEILLFKSKGTHSQKYSFLDRKKIRDREEIFETSVYPYDISNIKRDKKLKHKLFESKLIQIKGNLYFKTLSLSGNLLMALTYLKGGRTECQIWDIENKKQVKIIELDEYYVVGGFSPQDKYFYLTSDENQIIKLFDAVTFEEVSQFKGNAPVSFSSDNMFISFTNDKRELYLIDIKGKKEIFRTNTGHSSVISDIKFNENYNYIATASHDGLIKFWNIKNGQLLVSLAAFDENDFIYITSDNYYYSTKGAMSYIGFIENERLYTFEQFDVKFNRPDIVFSKLSYSTGDEIMAYKKAYEKRVQKMGFANADLSGKIDLPVCKFLNTDDFPISTTQGEITIEINATDNHEKIDRFNVWVNDVPLYGTNGFSVKDKNLNNISKSFPIKLSAGRNKIQVSATNTKGFESLKETFSILYDIEETKPDLYLVVIGVSEYKNPAYNLQYAAKDAQDLSNLYRLGKSKEFNKIHTKAILDKDATVDNILKLKTEINNSKVDDVVMLFFAGHGVLDDEMNYYLATTEIDVDNMSKTALRYDYLEGLFDGIPSRKKVIIIDACHSGEVDKEEKFTETDLSISDIDDDFVEFRKIESAAALETQTKITTQSSFELMKMMFADIRRGTGSTIISSAGGGEFAYETEEHKNGIFTYVLLNGILSKKADLNKDGDIMVSELRDYVSARVSKITGGYQNPTSRRENLEFDFQVW